MLRPLCSLLIEINLMRICKAWYVKLLVTTRVGVMVESDDGYPRIQWDFDQLDQWDDEWQMEFNSHKQT